MTWQVNAMAPYYIASAIMDHAPDSYLLFISSAEVYGRSAKPGVTLTEDTLLRPANPYASAKAAADLFVQEAALAGLRANVVRPFNHIGPGQSLAFAIPSFCSQIVASERGESPVIRVGSLEDVRDFLHVEDVVDAYVEVIKARGKLDAGAFFNVASGQGVRMRDVLNLLTSLSSVEVHVELDPSRLRQRPPTSVVGDAGLLRERTGWGPRHSLRDTLLETLDYWRRQ
jgi:GDP-4-dehydro-6-deoxy-D-mannose reductase